MHLTHVGLWAMITQSASEPVSNGQPDKTERCLNAGPASTDAGPAFRQCFFQTWDPVVTPLPTRPKRDRAQGPG